MNDPKPFFWRLGDLMHDRGIHQATTLQRLLEEQGINLSSSQVHRLVTQTPERLNLTVLSALCQILVCTPNDLVEVRQADAVRKAVNDADVVDMAASMRPRRARVTRPKQP